jgi:hypothetical protein
MRAGHIYFGGLTVNQDSSARSAGLSTTRKHTGATQQRSEGCGVFEGFGSPADGTFRSLGERCSKPSKADDVRVQFTPWRMSQSQFRYRGEPNVIDLGEL